MRRVSQLVWLGATLAGLCLALGPATAVAQAAGSSPPQTLRFTDLDGQVAYAGAYAYHQVGPQTATVWNASTGKTGTLAIPAGCGGSSSQPPVIGAGTLFWICSAPAGASGLRGWIYEILARRWVELSRDLEDCRGETACEPVGAGSRWVTWSEDTTTSYYCPDGCGSSEVYVNFQTGAVRDEDPDPGYNCAEQPGCLPAALSTPDLDFTYRPCQPANVSDFLSMGHGWDALEPNLELFVHRCGSARGTELSPAILALVGAQWPLVAWIPLTYIKDPQQLVIYNVLTRRRFVFSEPKAAENGVQTEFGAIIGRRLYQGSVVATIPAEVYAGAHPG